MRRPALAIALMALFGITSFLAAALLDGGVIAFHVSNNYIELVPVVSWLAEDAGLEVLARSGMGDVDSSLPTVVVFMGETGSESDRWGPGWEVPEPGPSLWTDGHADVLVALQDG